MILSICIRCLYSAFSAWPERVARLPSGDRSKPRGTTSFIRNGTLPSIAGNPPADAAQPSGINGIIVTVPTNVAKARHRAHPPSYSRSLRRGARQWSISETARKVLAAANTEHRLHPRNQRSIADIGNENLCLVFKQLLIAKEQKDNKHREAQQMVVEVLLE
jgi:hypothetical protein